MKILVTNIMVRNGLLIHSKNFGKLFLVFSFELNVGGILLILVPFCHLFTIGRYADLI